MLVKSVLMSAVLPNVYKICFFHQNISFCSVKFVWHKKISNTFCEQSCVVLISAIQHALPQIPDWFVVDLMVNNGFEWIGRPASAPRLYWIKEHLTKTPEHFVEVIS